ncbi:MAG: hypothetical protein M0T80_06960, partial [Actinomycetota bacterium]|nr:hypothetical protein [Actinomycetota bacterium]
PIFSVSWSPDNDRIVVANDTEVLIWDPHDPSWSTPSDPRRLAKFVWAKDNFKHLGTRNERCVLIDGAPYICIDGVNLRLDDPEPLGFIGTWVNSVAWSPDGRRIASGDCNGQVRVWDPEHPYSRPDERPQPIGTHDGGVTSVAWSPDGTRVVSGGDDGGVRVWDPDVPCPEAARRPEPIGTHDGRVTSVAWSPDGRRIASGGAGGLRVWEWTGSPCSHPVLER